MAHARFDGMSWPLPDGELEWRLRYAAPNELDRLAAASIVGAYEALLARPRREREYIIAQIRKASRAAPAKEPDHG